MLAMKLLHIIISISCVYKVLSQTYSCKGTNANPVEVPAIGKNIFYTDDFFTRTIQKSSVDTVCILLRITVAPNRNASLDDISRTSNLSDYRIVSVARSYAGYGWERVSGPYAQDLISICSSSTCDLKIPILSNLKEGRLFLMSFAHSLSQRETVSRFFQQTTFGPNLAMINSWDYSANMTNAMASWIESQMIMTMPTYHREYFRKRVDGEVGNSAPYRNTNELLRSHHPCGKSSRWMRMAFREEDYGQEITATERFDGTILLSVAGVPRTVVNSWQRRNGADIGMGTFLFDCWIQEFRPNGELRIRIVAENRCIRVQGGNPAIFLPLSSNLFKNIDLPPLAGPTKNVYLANRFNLGGETHYLSNAFSSGQCKDLDPSDYNNLIGTTQDGSQFKYAGYIELNNNSLDHLRADGVREFMITGKELCANPAMTFANGESCYLSVETNACSSLYDKIEDGDAVVICGSPGEVGNEIREKIFQLEGTTSSKSDTDLSRQKESVWYMVALDSGDQLRQRMAWALSQILVISPNQIEKPTMSEIFLNYYDIFVRHAFGNYLDVLREVAYSPMMGEMLSFVDSKSTTFVLKDTGDKVFPDENFAREIMQLFTIGVHKLSMDGTPILDSNGHAIPTYDNSDIQTFSRAWTGYTRLPRRANIEGLNWYENRIDPMRIQGLWRDSFPKMDLDRNFIGDTYPLCVDLPTRQFLRKGAKFRLLGSSTFAQLHHQSIQDGNRIKTLSLLPSSDLFLKLCNGAPDHCNFKATVTLTSNINKCYGEECFVDELRLIQVQRNPPVYYEYIRPPCVELAFYDNGKTIQLMGEERAMCANANVPVARDACCDSTRVAYSNCYHSFERTTFQTSKTRCEDRLGGSQCAWSLIDTHKEPECQYHSEDSWYWASNQDCTLQAKVSGTGTVAMVHNPNLVDQRKTEIGVSPTNTNYFKVSWDSDDYPRPSNECGNGVCVLITAGECQCDIVVEESVVFSSIPSVASVFSQLFIGGVDIPRFSNGEYYEAEGAGGVTVYHRNGTEYTIDTIFKVDYRGGDGYFKNVLSTVRLGASNYSFRNPPQFMNPAMYEPRDGEYETEAVLKHFFYHDNLPPFLAIRLIQRFGISNPSPRYVFCVAKAFKSGSYYRGGKTFGGGNRGDLAATVAAIILDREARTIVVDADPTAGSLREPILKLVSFFRAMEFEQNDSAPELRLFALQQKIGQAPHSLPNVFSFFLPEYSAPGHLKFASLKSPEAQVLTGPKMIQFINGFFSLIDSGLNSCYGGFGEDIVYSYKCENLIGENNDFSRGALTYKSDESKSMTEVVDELALLLTGGRLHLQAKNIIMNSYDSVGGGENGLKLAQKLFVSLPEFHATNVVNAKTSSRPNIEIPLPSTNEYKAVVFLMLSGGCDSFNLLVPKSGCKGKDMYQHYKSIRSGLSVPREDLLSIDASGSEQICSTFGIHPKIPILKSIYDDGDLLWISNLGVLQRPTKKESWLDDTTATSLFAHNVQQREVQNMDIYQKFERGVGGRMVDVLLRLGYSAGAVSVSGFVDVLDSNNASPLVTEPNSFETFNPSSNASALSQAVKDVNKATNIGSGLFSETWSSSFYQGLCENQLLDETLRSVELDQSFTSNDFSAQLETVAKMMQTKESRGTDRDIFYVEQRGFDTHSGNLQFDDLISTLNTGIEEFKNEMVNQGLWNNITIVMVSEFARTLRQNSGQGTDHAWGGNYFVAGGDINGKQILGEYPADLDGSGFSIFEPGIAIPTTPWESVWQGISQWLGITNSADLNEVIPNRNSFSNLFGRSTLYQGPAPSDPTPAPNTEAPTPVPSPDPSSAPTSAPTTKADPTPIPSFAPTSASTTNVPTSDPEPTSAPTNSTLSPTLIHTMHLSDSEPIASRAFKRKIEIPVSPLTTVIYLGIVGVLY